MQAHDEESTITCLEMSEHWSRDRQVRARGTSDESNDNRVGASLLRRAIRVTNNDLQSRGRRIFFCV